MHFLISIIAFFLIAIKLILVKAEVNIIYEDVEIITENEDFVKDVDIHVNDDNTAVFANLTILKRFEDDTRASMELIGASMGEYVVQTGVNFDIEVCQLFDDEHGGLYGTQFERFGFSPDDCPPSPGTYCNQEFSFDKSVLPDEFPNNNYLIIFKVLTDDYDIIEGHLFVRILS